MSNPIIKDQVNALDYKRLNYATACEDCTHFDHQTISCTLAFPVAPFLKAQQLKDLEEKGEMAFCRAIEID
jgi:hypothetical protein